MSPHTGKTGGPFSLPIRIARTYGYDRMHQAGWNGEGMTINLVEVPGTESGGRRPATTSPSSGSHRVAGTPDGGPESANHSGSRSTTAARYRLFEAATSGKQGYF